MSLMITTTNQQITYHTIYIHAVWNISVHVRYYLCVSYDYWGHVTCVKTLRPVWSFARFCPFLHMTGQIKSLFQANRSVLDTSMTFCIYVSVAVLF